MATRTRCAVLGCTPDCRFTTRDTVLRLTPATLATSSIVARAITRRLSDSVVTTTVDPYRSATVKGFADAVISPACAATKHFCHTDSCCGTLCGCLDHLPFHWTHSFGCLDTEKGGSGVSR